MALALAALVASTAATPAEAKQRTLRPHGAWVWLTDPVADAVAEGVDDPMSIPDSRDGCLMRVTRKWAVTIVCPDGSVYRG